MNLAKTLVQWTDFLGRELIGLALSMRREFVENLDFMTLQRSQVWVMDSRATFIGAAGVVLAGVSPTENTSVDGLLFARISANGGNWDIKIFKATGGGGGDEVARATNVAASATGTLVAQNSSGMSGTWTLPASVVATADDTLILRPRVDALKRAMLLLTGTEAKDAETLTDYKAMLATCAAAERTKIAAVDGFMRTFLIRLGKRGHSFTGRTYTDVLSEAIARDPTFPPYSVTRNRTGAAVDLKNFMEDEATGGEIDVVKRVVAAAAGVFDSGNDGQGAAASHTPLEHCPPMNVTLTCKGGIGTAEGGQEWFEAKGYRTDRDEEVVFEERIYVGRNYAGPRGFGGSGSFKVTRLFTKGGGDSSHVHLAIQTDASLSISGENEVNTSAGVVYYRLTDAGGGNVNVTFYSDSNRTKAVALASNVAAATAFQAVAQNNSGLTINWKTGSAPVAAHENTLDFNYFNTQRSTDGEADSLTVAVTVTTEGLIQRHASDAFRWPLNSDTSGAESIPDGHIKANGIPPFSVLSN